MILYQSDYSELRKIKGFENIADVPEAEDCKKKAEQIALNLGIEQDNIRLMTNKKPKDVLDYIRKELMKKWQYNNNHNLNSLFFVYCVG